MVADVGNEGIEHGCAMRRLHQVHRERNGIGALRTGRVAAVGWIEKSPVERGADLVCPGGELCCFIRLPEYCRRLRQNPCVVIIKCGCGQRNGRQLRNAGRARADVIPIAQAVRDNVLAGLRSKVSDVPFHAVVVTAEQFTVAGKLILLPRDDHEGATPFGRIAETAVEHGEFGRDVRDHTVCQLSVVHVVEYLPEKLRHPVVVHDRRADEVRLFEPPQFFAVRTVGRHRLHIALDGLVDDVMDLVPQGI